jgi:hypothetical protein
MLGHVDYNIESAFIIIAVTIARLRLNTIYKSLFDIHLEVAMSLLNFIIICN